jgi:hypothetical protein
MPSRKRKSRLRTSERSKKTDSLVAIRKLIPLPNEIFRLSDFLGRYAPALKVRRFTGMGYAVEEELCNMIVSPLETIRPAPHLETPERREPIPTIVDDVVWALVQRRDRWKRYTEKDGRNVLAQGFTSSPPQDYLGNHRVPGINFPSTRPGMTQWQANDNVTFCKTSRIFQNLHYYVGDEMLRTILLHARLFVPLETQSREGPSRGNYSLVCGSPLTNGAISQIRLADNVKTDTNADQTMGNNCNPRPVKKRRRNHPQVDQHLQANQSISRYNLFYSDSFTPKVGLHHKHPFHSEKMTPERLLASMTNLYTTNGGRRRKRWRRLRGSGVELCRNILTSGKTCDYHRLIERYCPLPDYCDGEVSDPTADKAKLKALVQCYSQPEDVASFARSVLTKVFPSGFWGSHHNLDSILQAVKAFVLLRRKECLSNKRLMHGIRTKHLSWLQGETRKNVKLSRTDSEATSRLALQVFRWLFRSFIIPLLRSNFYVTETEFGAKKVFYYRKPVWSAFRALSMRLLLKRQFRELSKAEVVKCLSSHRMGFSRLRLLPKTTGVRPIAHLSKPHHVNVEELLMASKRRKLDHSSGMVPPPNNARRKYTIWPSYESSTNSILAQLFDVLTYESTRHDVPAFGSGLEGLNDFYPRYQRYIVGLKSQRGRGQPLDLVFASVDIEKCYDNINQKYMYDIASRQITQGDYLIQRYHLLYGNDITGGIDRVSKKIVGPPEIYGLLHAGGQDISRKSSNAVLDSRTWQLVQRGRLCELLEEHLGGHLVVTSGRYEPRYLLQTGGISQGSILSMLLCNLYYGNMENLILNKDNPQSPRVSDRLSEERVDSEFLARLVDDFLFVSTSRPSTSNFLKRMWRGREELGVGVNKEKTLVSEEIVFEFDGDEGPTTVSAPIAPARHASNERLFPWCGMLFNCRTGEVSIDYQRFQDGDAKDRLTVDFVGSEGKKLGVRMESFARPRCLPILYDHSINTRTTIVINFYQMMLFSAAKTAEHLRSTDVNPTTAQNEGFLLSCVDSLVSYSNRQIRSNLRKKNPDRGWTLILTDETLLWLTWHAFSTVFFTQIDDFPSLGHRIHTKFQTQACPSSNLEGIVAMAYHRFSLDKIIEKS